MTRSRFSIIFFLGLVAFYLFFTVLSCKESISSNSVTAEFSYSTYTLTLTIKNNSEKAVYLLSKAIDNIKIYYKGKLLEDPNLLFDLSDLSQIPEPPIPDSTVKTHVTWEMPFINIIDNRNADSSFLMDHIFLEYKKINHLKYLSNQDSARIASFLSMYPVTIGELLLLKPHESFSFYKAFPCFKKMDGDYTAECHDLSVNISQLPSYVELDNFKIPIVFPEEINGNKRFDGTIQCNDLNFSTCDIKK